MSPQSPPPVQSTPSPKPGYTVYPPRRFSLSRTLAQSSRAPSPSYPQSPRIQPPPLSLMSPTFPRIQRVPSPPLARARIQSGSPTPSIPFSFHGTTSFPTTPSPTHLSISTHRDSSTPLPGAARLTGEYAERSAWERDEDEKSDRGKRCCIRVGKGRKRGGWLALLLVVGIIIVVSLGAGLGVGLTDRRRNGSKSVQLPLESLASTTIESTSAPAAPTQWPSSETSKFSISTTSSLSTLPSLLPNTIIKATTSIAISTSQRASSTPSLIPDPDPKLSPTSTTSPQTTSTSIRICPSPFPCNTSGCGGRNRDGELGWCTSGENFGCGCISICGPELGLCNQNGCGGADGICETGDWAGCPCLD